MKPEVITVAVSRADGGVSVMRVVTYEPSTGLRYDPTPAYVDSLIAKLVASGSWVGPYAPTGWRFVANDYVDEGTDRTFRGAWKDAGRGKPDVDMPKAREIHRNSLRDMRAPILEKLDTDYLRADEAGDQQAKKQVAAKKQALRDITADPRIEAAQTPEELKAVLPDALRG
jgi:hypothetical protein